MTSTLAQAIRFRVLVDQLRDSEFIQFTTHIVTRFGRDILLTPILNHIMGARSNRLDGQTVNGLIAAIKEVINAREEEPHAATASKVALDELIGEISSYLKQTELRSFCQSSRSIFAGCSEYVSVRFSIAESVCLLAPLCHSPIQLRELALLNVADYAQIDLAKYPRVRTLKLKLHKFDEFVLPATTGRVCNHLRRLVLDNDERHDTNIAGFMHSPCLNLDQSGSDTCPTCTVFTVFTFLSIPALTFPSEFKQHTFDERKS